MIHRVHSALSQFTWCGLDRDIQCMVGLAWSSEPGVADCSKCREMERRSAIDARMKAHAETVGLIIDQQEGSE